MPAQPIGGFTKSKVLFVEGKDEEAVISAIAKDAGRADIEALGVGGKDQFPNKFPPAVMQSSFKQVKALGIIQDADDDAEAAFKRVTKLLADHKLPSPKKPGEFIDGPIRVGILVLPGAGQTGYLENLFLASYTGSAQILCVDSFAGCCAPFRTLTTKERAHALLVAIGAPETRLGRAFESGQVNANGAAFAVLKDFVLHL
jgi:hypothetical protein